MEPGVVTFTIVFLIAIALLFDLINGMHDAANSIATVVSTRVLKPFHAVLWAAFFNFAAYFLFEAHVANTIGKGLISPDLIDNAVVFGALIGAIAWNMITWWGGIPSSSSHALVGGIVGAGVTKSGFDAIVWGGLSKTLYRHRSVTCDGFHSRHHAGDFGELALRAGQPGFCRWRFPQAAAGDGCAVFAGPWRQ